MGFSPGGSDRVFFVTTVTWGRRALFQAASRLIAVRSHGLESARAIRKAGYFFSASSAILFSGSGTPICDRR